MNRKILLISSFLIAGVFSVYMLSSSTEKTIDNVEYSEIQSGQLAVEDSESSASDQIVAVEEEVAGESGFSEKSKFNERCLNVIKKADKNIDLDNISVADQNNMSNLFNSCIYEIDMELALIERQFNRTAENMACLNRAYEVRDYLLDLGTNAQRFSDMTNNTDSDRVLIAETYSSVLTDILRNGRLAMDIRMTVCAKDG